MRRRGFSYADAATLLGGGENAIVRALDTALGGALLLATAGTSQLAISLFDAQSELTDLNQRFVQALSQRRAGLSRLDQTERIAAAHAVIAVTAFFETVREADLPFSANDLRLDRRTQARLATGQQSESTQRLGELAHTLAQLTVPAFSPANTMEQLRQAVEFVYQAFADRLRLYLQSLAAWDSLTETDQIRIYEILDRDLPAQAVRRWENMFRQLATQFPEMQFYVDRADHQATRERVSTGLAAIEERLRAATTASGDLARAALAKRYQAELGRPIVDSGDVPEYLTIPTLLEGYVDPDFRAVDAGAKDAVHLEGFWEGHPVQADLGGFLAAQLSSLDALNRPLLVLGQPGAGKSVLTRFLAGRLPANDVLVVRVELRKTPAEVDVQTQIEDAVRQATGEQIGWPALSRRATGSLRLVIFDGFDELLQVTGVGQSTYLREVAAFQEREADQDRPVAVVVTSRVSVADRALMPAEGAIVVRLEPFHDRHIDHWLQVWNQNNEINLRARHLEPLSLAAALVHRDLAEQPLLLLMLALYDADENGLQRGAEDLSSPDLYERLLERFARREIAKNRPELRNEGLTAAVRDELHRLSIAALSMFHRGRQWVTQADLDQDLHALLGETTAQRTDFKSPASPGAEAIGRFFFIHRTRSRRGEQDLFAVEFLHATFGEYLVARLIVNELQALVAVAELASTGIRVPEPDTGLLLDALAFTPVCVRTTVIASLKLRIGEFPPARRKLLVSLLLRTFRAVATGELVSASEYRPVPQTPAGRQAMQSLNLLLLMLYGKESVTASELFGTDEDPALAWRTHATLWYSQCTDDAWTTLLEDLKVTRIGGRSDRDIEVSTQWFATWIPDPINPLWTSRFGDGEHGVGFGWAEENRAHQRRTTAILQDRLTGYLYHVVEALEEPIGRERGHDYALAGAFAMTGPGTAKSAGRALLDLWIASAQASGPEPDLDGLAQAYRDCLAIRNAFPPNDWWNRNRFFRLVIRQIVTDAPLLSRELLMTTEEETTAMADGRELRPDRDPVLTHWLALLHHHILLGADG
jgi:hypothetical protein